MLIFRSVLNGLIIGSVSLNLLVAVYAQAGLESVWVRAGHSDYSTIVAISPDDQYIASAGGGDSTVKLWRLSDGEFIRTVVANPYAQGDRYFSVVFSPDGQYLVTVGQRSIDLWRVPDGTHVRRFSTQGGKVAFSYDGSKLAGIQGRSIKIWSVPDGTEIGTLTIPNPNNTYIALFSVAFSPDGSTVAAGGQFFISKYIFVWDANSQTYLRAIQTNTQISEIVFLPDNITVATACSDRFARLWNIETGTVVRSFEHPDTLAYTIALSRDGTLLASGGFESRIFRLWRVSDGTLLRTFTATKGVIESLAFTSDSNHILVGGRQFIRLWNRAPGAIQREYTQHTDQVTSVAFSPDGSLVASSTTNTESIIRIWNSSNGALVRAITGHPQGVLQTVFAPNGNWLASGGIDGTARLWRVADGALLRVFNASAPVWSVAISPDNQLIAAGSADAKVRVWRIDNGQLIFERTTREYDPNAVSCVLFSPDSSLLAVGDTWGNLILYRTADGSVLWSQEYRDHIMDLAFSSDGSVILIGTWGSTIYLRNTADGSLVWSQVIGIVGVKSLHIAPDGIHFALATLDGAIEVRRMSDGGLLRRYERETLPRVLSIRYSPNNCYLAYSRTDGTLFMVHNPYGLLGDVNADGVVDDSDLLIVLFAFGSSGSNLPEDVNKDGIVDDADLLMVLFNFGRNC